jgi:uncharacterized protein YdcH (DUF465 family)
MQPSLILNYSLIGLGGLLVFLFWKILDREQRGSAPPRKALVNQASIFIVVSLLMAGAGVILELSRIAHAKTPKSKSESAHSSVGNAPASPALQIAQLKQRLKTRDAHFQKLKAKIADLDLDVVNLPTSIDTTVSVRPQENLPPQKVPVKIKYPEAAAIQKTTDSLKALVAEAQKSIDAESKSTSDHD